MGRSPGGAAALVCLLALAAPGAEAASTVLSSPEGPGASSSSGRTEVELIGGTYANSLGYDGAGTIAAVSLTGFDKGSSSDPHPDMVGRIAGRKDYTESQVSDGVAEDWSGSGTHMAGSIAGTGSGSSDDGRGMAPAGSIFVQRVFDDNGNWAASSYSTMWGDASRAGAQVVAIGWGSSAYEYTSSAEWVDRASRDADSGTPGDQPLLFVVPAGSDGSKSYTIITPGQAKNAITVGASGSPRHGHEDYVQSWSSRGPAADGRIKPELVAPGEEVPGLHTRLRGSSYATFTGTGVSAGLTAGAAAIVHQYLSQSGEFRNSAPSPELVRAMLVNWARDLPDGVPIPNRGEGWGIVDLRSTIPLAGAWRDSPAALQQGREWTMKFTVNSSAKPVRVTLAWTDPAAQAGIGSSRALINDLDLHLDLPNGGHIHGNWFANGWSEEGGWDDRYNNLENIYLKAPAPGNYTLRVYANDIDADAVSATPEPDQDFALVLRGEEVWWGDAARVSIEPKSPSLDCSQTVQFSLKAYDSAGKQVPLPTNPAWSVSGGWSSQWGLFTPALPGSFTVTGKSGSLADSATFDVAACGPVPTILETRPAAGATGVGEREPLSVKFSAPMDRKSVESSVSISPSADFDASWEEGDSRLVLKPRSPLSPTSSYTVSVGAGVKALLGKALASGAQFAFTTRAPPQEFITVTGTVRAVDGTPIEGATVTAVERVTGQTLAEDATDSAGSYALRIPAGKEYDLRIRAPGLDEVTVGGGASAQNVGVTLRKPGPPAGPPMAVWLGIGGAGVAIGIGALALLLGDIVLWALLAIPAAMLMRIRRDEVLDHFVRGQVFGAIKLKPGITYSEIRRELDVANGTLAYHLHVLMREGFISTRREGVYTCFYAGAVKGLGKGVRLSLLQQRIIEEMKKEPGVSQSVLAERLAEPMKTVHYNVRRMQQSGLVKVEKEGRVSHCFSLVPEAAAGAPPRPEEIEREGGGPQKTEGGAARDGAAGAPESGASVPPPPDDEQ